MSVKKCKRGTLINDVELSHNVDWKTDNLNLLQQNYYKAPYFNEIHPIIEKLYDKKHNRLIDFNVQSINMLCDLFNIKTEIIFASELGCNGAKNSLLVELLQKVKADSYLSGVGAKDYLEPEMFEKAGIKVIWQEFKHPIYPQLYDGFVPLLSSIDILYNCGIKKSREYLRSNL